VLWLLSDLEFVAAGFGSGGRVEEVDGENLGWVVSEVARVAVVCPSMVGGAAGFGLPF
jgi:hypothetical protein